MTSLVDAARVAPTHPWNRSFGWRHRADWSDATGPLHREQVEAFDRDGFFVAEGVLDPARLARVARAIAPHDDAVNAFLRELPDGRFDVAAADRLTVTLHPSTLEEACRDLAFDPWFSGVCRQLVGPRSRLYWDQAVYKHPGYEEPVPWHQDNGYQYVEPQDYLTCWVPLADATVDNGGVWVVPGAHRRGTLAHRQTETGWRCLEESVEGAVAVEAPVGSVVVFSSLTPHRTGPNTTDGLRPAYILQYAPDGAELLEGDPSAPPTGRRRLDEAGRQEPV